VAAESSGAAGVADRYSTALYELAESDKLLEAVAEDLEQVRQLIDESADFRRLILSPVLSREDQGRAIAALAEKAGFNDLTRRFLGLLARNRRLFALDGIIKAYASLLAAGRGETSAEVVSAKELTKKQLTDLRAALKKAVGSDVAVHTQVDPALLGGLVVKVGSRMIDSSLNTKLQHLRLAMKGIG
jgi:F-type H+-transporting ATPase subunit delta